MPSIMNPLRTITALAATILLTYGMDAFDNKRDGTFTMDHGKVLKGNVIDQRTVTSPLECSHVCLRNGMCLSFNYKLPGAVGGVGVCELNNATRITSPHLYQDNTLYDYYFDPRVENFRSCLDYLRDGAKKNGIYTITDTSGDSYQVFCDVTSEPRSAWTLILSFAFKNRKMDIFCSKGLSVDAPHEMNNPNWEAYRLSSARMKRLKSQSTHVRFTTDFAVEGVDFRDYMRAKLSSVDVLTSTRLDYACKKVEYVNIRGLSGSDVTISFWSAPDNFFHVESDSSKEKGCQFDGSAGAVAGENNFGRYCWNVNKDFRGCASDESTTEHWFGGYL